MPHRIVFVVFPDFQQLDVAGPLAAFEVAAALCPGHYRWRLVATQPGAVRSSAGVAWPAAGLPRRGSFDTVVVSGGDGVNALLDGGPLQDWLRRVAGRGPRARPQAAMNALRSMASTSAALAPARRATAASAVPSAPTVRMASVCSGSLVLAAAGLLDGRAATTHWSRTEEFRQRFPQVRLDADRIFTRDGPVWTSAGITAGIDLALALIADDLGDALARRVAQQLVVLQRRAGGQSQFSELLALQAPDGRFTALLDAVRARLDAPHRVADLAEQACMSPRHFARAFAAETGSTPARAVERLRVEAARAALDSGAVSIQRVARDCGFGQPERMRRSFIRLYGAPPAALKRQRSR